jgi:hypothetical protein
MLRIALLSSLLSALLLTACGGSGDQKLTELSRAEVRDLCEYAIEVNRSRTNPECGSDDPEAEQLAECIAELEALPSSCGATRDQAEACVEAQAERGCDDDVPECDVFQSDDCDEDEN